MIWHDINDYVPDMGQKVLGYDFQTNTLDFLVYTGKWEGVADAAHEWVSYTDNRFYPTHWTDATFPPNWPAIIDIKCVDFEKGKDDGAC